MQEPQVGHRLPGLLTQSYSRPFHSGLESPRQYPDDVGTYPRDRASQSPLDPGRWMAGNALCMVSAHYVLFPEDIIYMLNAYTMQRDETELCHVV